MRARAWLVLAAAASAAVACASVTTGTTQAITMMTEPDGARCELRRAGMLAGAIARTPGTVTVEKSKDPLDVLCQKDGHEDGRLVLASTFQGMTAGNALIGGLIGVAIDASTGAMNEYPLSASLLMPPKRFASDGDRDAFYDRAKENVRRRADEAIERARQQCARHGRSDCDETVKKLETTRDQDVEALEQRRLSSQVASG